MSNRFPVSVTGRLATDPSLSTATASPLVKFRLAVDDRRQAPDGSWETRQTVFHDVAAWGRLAEVAADQLRRGDAVVVAGTLKFDTYQQDGKERTRSEIVADAIGPDLRLSTVTIDRTARGAAAGRDDVAQRLGERAREVARSVAETATAQRSAAAPAPSQAGI